MRKLMWFTIGFALSCGLCAYGLPDSWIIPGMAAWTLAMLAAALLSKNWKRARGVGTACLGCVLGLGWYLIFQAAYLSPVSALDNVQMEAVLTASDYSYETDYGIGVDGFVEIQGKTYQVRAYLDGDQMVEPGDSIRGRFRFRVTAPDGERASSYYQGKGIFLLAYQKEDASVVTPEETPWWCAIPRLRAWIQSVLQDSFTETDSAFAKALLLGDTTNLSYETDTDLKISGIRHVAAVSGLHISILFALISAVTFRKRYLTALVGLPALLLFAALAGFTPSVVRACIMSGLMLLAMLFGREYDSPTALAFAVLAMLAVNPLTITSVSFQLSVASVAGILMFQPPIQNWMKTRFKAQKGIAKRLQSWVTGSVSVTLSAMTFTTPLSAYYFSTVSLVGVVTNLLTLWIISFVFYGLMAVCAVSLFWQAGAAWLGKAISVPIRYVLSVAGLMADLPLAAEYTKSVYVVAWLVFCYVLLVVFLLQKKRRPALLGCCAVVGLCLALLASWVEPRMDGCRVTVLDVGQGQSILLQSEGRTYLIDCGGDNGEDAADTVAETLLSQGIIRLDGIILTHYDADHAGGLEPLLTRVQTDLLLVPDTVDAKAFPQVEGTVCYVDEDVEISFGGAKITVFGPIYSGSSNENSLCVLFETENCVILVTGDRSEFGERMLMRRVELPDVDLLIAGHHGSKTSTSEELLQTVTPETVIISVGANNLYGHPAAELLERLEEFGCDVYRTDINGTILYRR